MLGDVISEEALLGTGPWLRVFGQVGWSGWPGPAWEPDWAGLGTAAGVFLCFFVCDLVMAETLSM